MTYARSRMILFFGCFVMAVFLLGLASHLRAQQGGLQPDGVYPYQNYPYPYFSPGPGQTPAPYVGVPTYNPYMPPYAAYPPNIGNLPGMPRPLQPGTPSFAPQQAPAGYMQSGLRSCSATSVPVQSPQAPAPTTPVQSPWLGVGEPKPQRGVQEVAGSQSSGGQSGGGLDLSPAGLSSSLLGRLSEGSKNLSKGQEAATGKKERDGVIPGAPFVPYPEPFSTLEAPFNVPVFPGQLTRELRQYGYSLFANPISTFAPVEDVPVGPDYILGPGDSMAIRMWGSMMDSSFIQSLDRNGQITLPYVGPVRLWGLTFKDAGEMIKQQLSRYYRGIQTSVTMGSLRTMRIYVVGEVCQPGSYTLSSLSTVTNALFAAGGPVKLGSLRRVELKRNHHAVGTVDLYDFLLRGDKTRDFRLESGDTIFVPPVGAVVGVTGEVKRPAIYELQGTTRVSDLIEMAGGTTPQSYLKRVQVIRTKPNAEREVIDLDLTAPHTNGDSPADIELNNGDMVTVYPTDPRIYNTVRLAGAVKHPGEYEFKPDMRLSQLVQQQTALPEAHLEQVEIARLTKDLTTQILQVNLKQAWTGDKNQDVLLQPLDQITLRSEYRTPWSVTLNGEVQRPGTYTIKPGERLSATFKRAGGFTDKAYPRGAVFIRTAVRELEKEKLVQFMRGQQERLLADATTISSGIGSISKDEAAAAQGVLVQRLEQLQIMASKLTLGRVVIHLDDNIEKLEGSPDDLVLQDGDSLYIPMKPASVMVVGSVRNPTSVMYKESEDVQYYLNRAGGLSPGSAEKETFVVKADGSALTGFLRLRNIDPGDVIVVPPSTETKVNWVSVFRDLVGIVGQAAIGIAGVAGIIALH